MKKFIVVILIACCVGVGVAMLRSDKQWTASPYHEEVTFEAEHISIAKGVDLERAEPEPEPVADDTGDVVSESSIVFEAAEESQNWSFYLYLDYVNELNFYYKGQHIKWTPEQFFGIVKKLDDDLRQDK